MAFSLTYETEGAIPIAALNKAEFPAWLERAPERERNWLASIGFSAEAGKHALVPGETGRLARVLVGLGDGADAEGRMWTLAGLPAVIASLAASGLALFLIGAGTTLFTGLGVWFSGLRQLLIGFAAAGVTYGVGKLIGVAITG